MAAVGDGGLFSGLSEASYTQIQRLRWWVVAFRGSGARKWDDVRFSGGQVSRDGPGRRGQCLELPHEGVAEEIKT